MLAESPQPGNVGIGSSTPESGGTLSAAPADHGVQAAHANTAPIHERLPTQAAQAVEPAVPGVSTEHASSGHAASSDVLHIDSLCKAFRGRPAVAGVSLSVPGGSIFGLVGPNGSGKTTTLRMACGLLRPDSGRVTVDSIDVWTDPLRAKALIGVVPDPLLLFDRLTGREHLQHTGVLRGLDSETIDNRTSELLRLMGLTEAADQQIHSYSHGMRKKLALAVALIHRPRLLLLDEPFEGVDPVSVVALRGVLDRFRNNGSSVVISSHAMELVERHCDHVAIIAKGQVLATGPTAAIANGGRLEDAFIRMVGAQAIDDNDLSWMADP